MKSTILRSMVCMLLLSTLALADNQSSSFTVGLLNNMGVLNGGVADSTNLFDLANNQDLDGNLQDQVANLTQIGTMNGGVSTFDLAQEIGAMGAQTQEIGSNQAQSLGTTLVQDLVNDGAQVGIGHQAIDLFQTHNNDGGVMVEDSTIGAEQVANVIGSGNVNTSITGDSAQVQAYF